MPSRFKDAAKRWRTTLGLHAAPGVVAISVVIGIAAVVFAPTVRTRSDANDLAATFGVLLTVVAASTAAYAAIARTRRKIRAYALVAGGIGCAAAIAGLFQLPLGAYRYAFGVAIGAFADNVLTLIILLMA